MPLVTVYTYRPSSNATLVDIVINGPDSVDGFYGTYTVSGIMSSGPALNLSNYTTWSITAGNTYASINGSGVVTNTNNDSAPHNITIQATTTYNDITVVQTRNVWVMQSPDVYFTDVSILLSGDTSISVTSVEIVGESTIQSNSSVDFQALGSFSDGNTYNVDGFTTWSIVSGNAHGSINTTTGVFTANEVDGIQNVTVRAATFYNGKLTFTDQNVSVISSALDFYFNQTSLMLAGDSLLQLVSNTIYGSESLGSGLTFDYTVEGTLSDQSVVSVDGTTTWDITSGGTYASINTLSGALTVNNDITSIHNVVIRATSTFGSSSSQATKTVVVHPVSVDPYFSNTSFMLAGDPSLALVSTVINGPSTLTSDEVYDLSVTGTYSDNTTENVDADTTWEITAGELYASINASSGVLTVGSNISGIQNVSVRATTTIGSSVVYSNLTITVYGVDVDSQYTNVSLMLAGDSNATIVSATISGSDSLTLGGTHDYSVSGTLSNGSSINFDATTTWDITAGASYASINSSSGVLTAAQDVSGTQTVTIRSTSTFGTSTYESTKNVTIYGIVSTTISGASTLTPGNTHDYSVSGTLGDSSTISVDANTTWTITAGGSYASINATTGVVTVNGGVTGTPTVTIEALTTLGSTQLTSSKNITIYGVDVDPYFATNTSMMLSGDSTATLVSTTINGNSSIVTGNSFDYSVTGTLSSGSTLNLDASTTWDITVGGSYASINATTGVLTANGGLTGTQVITIRSTSTFGTSSAQATKQITIYGTDVDQYFSSNSMLLSGDRFS